MERSHDELLEFLHRMGRYDLNKTETVLWSWYGGPVVIKCLKISLWEFLHKWQRAHEKSVKIKELTLPLKIIGTAVLVSMLAVIVSAVALQFQLALLFCASAVSTLIIYTAMRALRENAADDYYRTAIKKLKNAYLCEVPIIVNYDDIRETLGLALDRITPEIRDRIIASFEAGRTEAVQQAIDALIAEEREEKARGVTKAASQILGRRRSGKA